MINRRQFVRAGVLGPVAALALSRSPNLSAADDFSVASNPFRGLKIGIASYSLRKFSLAEAVDMTRTAGLDYICLKDMHLPMNSTREERKAAAKLVRDAGLELLGCGVVYMKNDADEIRHAFQYASDAGMPTIVCAPDPAGLDHVERMVKEFDIQAAIHNHGPGDKWYYSVNDAARRLEGRDPRMGLCVDIGHSVRIKEDPAALIRRHAARVLDVHFKDVTKAAAEGKNTPLGRGVIDLIDVLNALLEIKFSGLVGLEYEIDADDPLPGIRECCGYLRGALAAMD